MVLPSKDSTSLIANLSFAECHKREKFMCKACTVSVVLPDSRRWGAGVIWSWRYFEVIIFLTRSQDSVVCVVTSLWDGRPSDRGSFPGRQLQIILFSNNLHTGSLAHPASSTIGTGRCGDKVAGA